jgi:hypothetical protein
MATAKVKKETAVADKPTKKLVASQLTVGDFLSRTSYMKITAEDRPNRGFSVKNEGGVEWSIDKNILEKECYSADQYAETKVVTRTELVNIFQRAGDAVFTVWYTKKEGELRKLVGYLINVENGFGRSNVVDLEVKTGHRMRQVDHRTIEDLILKNVRYQIKGA